MKIGILVESFPRISETWLANQIIDLIERGNEVSIYSVYSCNEKIVHQQVRTFHLIDRTQYFFNPKVNRGKQILLGINFMLSNLGNAKLCKLVNGLKALLLKKIEPLFVFNFVFLRGMQELDILHSHFGEIGVCAAKMRRAGLIPDTKIVVSFHGHDIFPYRRDYYARQYTIFSEYADALLVNSPYSLSLLNNINPDFQAKILPVGLSSSYFKPTRNTISNSKVRLIFLGRLVHLKGGLLMIDIFQRLLRDNPELELIMIGNGEERDEIEKKVKDNGLSDSIFLKGALSQENIIDEFNSGSIYVYPGLFDPYFQAGDTQGLVVQEAQAMELPVVCSDIGGIKFGLRDGETGFLIDEGDVDGFVEKIQILILDQKLREKMGRAGREYVLKYFDSKVIGDQLMKIYSEVLHDN